MSKVFVHLATGFEEIEAITPIDVLRRAGIDVKTISMTDSKIVVGAHNIPITCDLLFDEADYSDVDMLFLPGGIPGATNLDAHAGLKAKILEFGENGKYLSAICAAPLVLGHNGILTGKRATCYPGFEKELFGATISEASVVTDGKVITGKGAGVALEFALKLVEIFKGKTYAFDIAAKMMVD